MFPMGAQGICRTAAIVFLSLAGLAGAVWANGHPKVEGVVDIKREPAVITVGGAGADLPAFTSRAIQFALDVLKTRGGGTVKLNPGTYEMTGPVHLGSNMALEGSGPDTVLRKSAGVRTGLLIDVGYGVVKIEVEDSSGFPVGTGIQIHNDDFRQGYGVSTAVVTAVKGNTLYLDTPTIQDYEAHLNGTVTNAFPIVAVVEAENVRIANLVIDGDRKTNDYINGCRGGGVYLFRVRNVEVNGVHVTNFHGDAFSWQITEDVTIRSSEASHNGGIGFHPGTGTVGTVMEGNLAHHNRHDGIFLCYRVQNGVFRGNKMYANERYGLSIGHKDTDNLFENNEIFENASHGVMFRDNKAQNAGHRNTLRGNRIENNGAGRDDAYGICIRGETRDIVIENNTIRSEGTGQKAAVFIGKEAGAVTVKDNRVEGHPEVEREAR